MESSLLDRFARDYLALGSWALFVLIGARAAIEPYWEFLIPLLICAVVFVLLEWWRYEGYVLKGSAAVVLTSFFYRDVWFTVFAVTSLVVLLFAARRLKTSWSKIVQELVIGLLVAFGAQFVV